MSKYLTEKVEASRSKARELGGDVAVEIADNTLDMMTARELKGEDRLPDEEMKDELFQCE